MKKVEVSYFMKQWNRDRKKWVYPQGISMPKEYYFKKKSLIEDWKKWAKSRSKTHRGERFRVFKSIVVHEEIIEEDNYELTVQGLTKKGELK